jgi:nitroreductase
MEFNSVIKKRRSIRTYADKKLNIKYILDAIESANLAPSPGNLSLLRYIIVEDPEKIAKLAQASRQEFIKKAKFIVAVCCDHKTAITMYEERAEKYTEQHVGAAVENFLLKITELGLACCWIGAFSDITVRNILKLPEEIEIEALLPVAYESKLNKSKQPKKPELTNIIFYEKFEEIHQKHPVEPNP